MKKLLLVLLLILVVTSMAGCIRPRAADADDLIVAVPAAPAAADTGAALAPTAGITDTVTITRMVTITSVVAPPAVVPPPPSASLSITDVKALLVEALATLPTPAPASDPALMATDLVTKAVELAAGRPIPWMADNGQVCDWGVPSGTVLTKQTAEYIFTNCTSFNLRPGKSLETTWSYDQKDFDFLMANESGSDGMAWWGPLSGSIATVTYNGGPACTGRSFEVVPGTRISAKFVNAGLDTMATWSQGNWGVALRKLYEPECRPGTSAPPSATPTTAPAAPASAPPPTAPVAPPIESELRSVTEVAYGPITFKSGDAFQIQHLGGFVFHTIGGGYETTAKNFACTWQDWASGAAEPPWTGNSKVTCVWSPE